MSNVIPRDFIKHEVENEGDWSEWVCPDPTQYFMKCCDCGLVHEMQFKVVKYSEGDECDGVDDPDVQAVFRARRVTPPAAQQEPVAWAVVGDGEHGEYEVGRMLEKKSKPNSQYWEARGYSLVPLYTTPPEAQQGMTIDASAPLVVQPHPAFAKQPAAQREWVWLSRKDEQEIKDNCTTVACVLKAVKAKLKEKNT